MSFGLFGSGGGLFGLVIVVVDVCFGGFGVVAFCGC